MLDCRFTARRVIWTSSTIVLIGYLYADRVVFV